MKFENLKISGDALKMVNSANDLSRKRCNAFHFLVILRNKNDHNGKTG
jgi:hypothetical protein